jgi:hypothetical protein
MKREEETDGIRPTTLRKISILRSVSHPNILCLKDIFVVRTAITLFTEWLDFDLRAKDGDRARARWPSRDDSQIVELALHRRPSECCQYWSPAGRDRPRRRSQLAGGRGGRADRWWQQSIDSVFVAMATGSNSRLISSRKQRSRR